MHAILGKTLETILAQAIALEQNQQAISQVLGIIGCSGATDIGMCGGGTTAPFITADIADDPAVIGEIEAALASVGINLNSCHEMSRTRHYSAIPETDTGFRFGVTVLLRLLPADPKAA